MEPDGCERCSYYVIFFLKIRIHSSCEIEYFVETHLCKLCVILRIYDIYHFGRVRADDIKGEDGLGRKQPRADHHRL